MDKILGKSIIFLLLMLHVQAYAYITLEVNSFDGRKITEVAAGEPFVLKISTDEVDYMHDLQIQGLEEFASQKTGLSLITINGKKTAQVNYQVHVDVPGVYTFGPAYAPNGQTQSDAVTLKVNAEKIVAAHATKEADARSAVMLRLYIDNDSVFVGQKIKTMLRAYFQEGDDIKIDQIISNDPATIETSEKSGPKRGTDSINGKKYIFLEWQWDMYPKEPGTLVVPAYFVDYAKALPVQQGFGSFAMFFGPRYERKRAYSNALSITVRALPESPEPVQAVGTFVSFRAQIHPPVAKKYEGMVLTLTVEGEGNMESLSEPELIGLPDAFKYYFSKSNVSQGAFGQQKSFEYIVQGMEEGEWEIPAQTFRFFDVESRSYKTLESGAMLVTVTAGQPAVHKHAGEQTVVQADDAANTHNLLPIMYDESKNVLPLQGAMSAGLFAVLLLLPLVVLGVISELKSGRVMQIISPHYMKRCAFVYAQKDLARAYRHHDVKAIYGIFMQLFLRRGGSSGEVHLDQAIASSTFSDDKKRAWQTFCGKISQAAYAESSGTKEVVRLFHEAAQWLKDLEGIL